MAINIPGCSLEIADASYDIQKYGSKVDKMFSEMTDDTRWKHIQSGEPFVRLVGGPRQKFPRKGTEAYKEIAELGVDDFLESIDEEQAKVAESIGASVIPHEWVLVPLGQEIETPFNIAFNVPLKFSLGAAVTFLTGHEPIDKHEQFGPEVSNEIAATLFEAMNHSGTTTWRLHEEVSYPMQYMAPLPSSPGTFDYIYEIPEGHIKLVDIEPHVFGRK